MAAKIQDVGSNVVPMKGRKKPGTKAKAKPSAAEAAAAVQSQIDAGAEQEPVTAPSLGHNEPDESTFLQHVQKVRRQQERCEVKRLELKNERKILKDTRMGAREAGIVLGELDEALENLEKEHLDLLDRERRRYLYHAWLGIPLNAPRAKTTTTAADEEARWRARGEQDGRLGKPRELPEGIPPERTQAYLRGHDIGQEALMRTSPLTAEAFKPKAEGEEAGASTELGSPAAPKENLLILKVEHFATGTDLADANLKTLVQAHREAFDAADRVVAVFAGAKRVLKEPDDTIEGGFYVDLGTPDTPVSDPEPVSAEELA